MNYPIKIIDEVKKCKLFVIVELFKLESVYKLNNLNNEKLRKQRSLRLLSKRWQKFGKNNLKRDF
jgi:hypothetical protein